MCRDQNINETGAITHYPQGPLRLSANIISTLSREADLLGTVCFVIIRV